MTKQGNVKDIATNCDKARTWHWFSTPKTAELLELSVLALVETILAVALYSWIAISGYTIHLVVSACISPFLLLRTSLSVELAFSFAPEFL